VSALRDTNIYRIYFCSGHTDEINQIKSNASKMRLASCSDDQTARIWNIADLAGHSMDASYDAGRVTVLQGHGHCVSGVEWSTHHTWNEIVATSVDPPLGAPALGLNGI
jgi:transducin (beta)-like 1